VAISLDNEFLIASSLENKAMLYKLKTMRTVHTFSGHKDIISACRFSYSKKNVLTGSLDRTIKFWDIEKGICTRTVSLLPHIYSRCIECVYVSMF
jgi:autophagy-related protein 16